MTYYVNMIDHFMSGWGLAKNGRSIYCIRCANHEQASAAYLAASKRKEMRHVRIATKPRVMRDGDHRKIVDFYSLGPVWKMFLSKELA